MIALNMNDMVAVELTESGLKAREEYREKTKAKLLQMGLPEDSVKWPNNSTSERMPLWEAMSIFGPSLFNGCNIPFVNNRITVAVVGEE